MTCLYYSETVSTLERHRPGPSGKGDWIDHQTGETYDGCSPGKSQFLVKPKEWKLYQESLHEHVNPPSVNYVVVDITDLGLSKTQISHLKRMLDGFPTSDQAKIVRIGF
mgnify:CR=1 FL=1